MRIEKNDCIVNLNCLNIGDTFCCNYLDYSDDDLYLVIDCGACGEIINNKFNDTKNDVIYCVNLNTNKLCRFRTDIETDIENVIRIDSKVVINRN